MTQNQVLEKLKERFPNRYCIARKEMDYHNFNKSTIIEYACYVRYLKPYGWTFSNESWKKCLEEVNKKLRKKIPLN